VAGGGVENCVSEHEWARAAGFRGIPHRSPRDPRRGHVIRCRATPRAHAASAPAPHRTRPRRLFAAASRAPCPLLRPRFPLAASRFSSTPARLICCLAASLPGF
jgi:hypothetical protein